MSKNKVKIKLTWNSHGKGHVDAEGDLGNALGVGQGACVEVHLLDHHGLADHVLGAQLGP